MAKKELYRLDAFIFESEDEESGITLHVRNIADTWRMSFTERNPLQHLWLQTIGEAKGRLSARKTLEATFAMLFALSNLGLHDTQLTEDLVNALKAAHGRISLVLDRINAQKTAEEEAEDAEDDADWAKRAQTLDEMRKEGV